MISLVLLLLSMSGDVLEGSKAIKEKSIAADLFDLARVEMEGRDSPSSGQRRAADLIVERFKSVGLVPCEDSEEVMNRFDADSSPENAGSSPDKEGEAGSTQVAGGTFLRPFTRGLEAPVIEDCSLSYEPEGSDSESSGVCGVDWVPVLGCSGRFEGELRFAGFGVRSKKNRYDDLSGQKLKGCVAMIVEGEPRHKRKFDGAELTDSALLWSKLEDLQAEGVEGVLLVRRQPQLPKGKRSDFEALEFEYRYSNAYFPGTERVRPPRRRPPVIEITAEFAQLLTGADVSAWAEKVDKAGSPKDLKCQPCVIKVKSTTRLQQVRVDNVVGVLPGSDPELKDEYVVVGAHYDHIGVGIGGRVGPGADDNGSGTAGLLAVAEALKLSRPRRSIIVCAFSGEEAGLLGSKALCASLPVSQSKIVAMLNMDMIGRGGTSEVAVLGTALNKDLGAVLKRAQKLGKTGVKQLVTDGGEDLWARSDHFSFHSVGIPVLFFFEGLPISRNPDYHTWRDLVSLVDTKKIMNTSKLVHQTLCLLANEDSRPRDSQRQH
jgi:hypothetical protein